MSCTSRCWCSRGPLLLFSVIHMSLTLNLATWCSGVFWARPWGHWPGLPGSGSGQPETPTGIKLGINQHTMFWLVGHERCAVAKNAAAPTPPAPPVSGRHFYMLPPAAAQQDALEPKTQNVLPSTSLNSIQAALAFPILPLQGVDSNGKEHGIWFYTVFGGV